MFKFALVVCAFVAVAHGQNQYVDPKTAAIISEQRYLSGDGKFGAAYTQEDGTDFKEETDADGTRHGSYSYIDPNGQKRTVSYTAGKDGFRATGDHLPVGPAPPAHAAPAPAAPRYVQQQQQQQPQHFASAPIAPRLNEDYEDGQYDPRWNDPSFQGQGGNTHAAPAPQQPQYVQAPAPQQPQYVPQQPQQQQQYVPQQQQQQQYVPQQQPQYHAPAAQPAYYTTTPNPHRFQPPGQLALSRTPDGFSFSFNKV